MELYKQIKLEKAELVDVLEWANERGYAMIPIQNHGEVGASLTAALIEAVNQSNNTKGEGDE